MGVFVIVLSQSKYQDKRKARFFSSTFFPQKSSKKLGAGFKVRRSTPEN
jgi:hypothetical protein